MQDARSPKRLKNGLAETQTSRHSLEQLREKRKLPILLSELPRQFYPKWPCMASLFVRTAFPPSYHFRSQCQLCRSRAKARYICALRPGVSPALTRENRRARMQRPSRRAKPQEETVCALHCTYRRPRRKTRLAYKCPNPFVTMLHAQKKNRRTAALSLHVSCSLRDSFAAYAFHTDKKKDNTPHRLTVFPIFLQRAKATFSHSY